MSQLKQQLESLNLSEQFLIDCHVVQAKNHLDQAYQRTNKTHQQTQAYLALCDVLAKLFYADAQAGVSNQTIPFTYFSFAHQQDIIIKYEELLINSTKKQTKNIPELEQTKNNLFLSIGKSLQVQKEQSKALIKKAIDEYAHQSFKEWFIHHHRCLMIKLFAKEHLSDNEYQKALKTGQLKPIMAIYKCLWPFKWLAALINSLLLPLQYLKDIPRQYTKFFNDRLKQISQQGPLSFKDSFFKTLYIFVVLLSLSISYYFIISADTPYLFYLAPILVYADILEIFANPINQFLIPVSEKLNVSPILLGAFTGLGLVILFYNLAFFQVMETLGIIYLAIANYQRLIDLSQLDLSLAYLGAVLVPYSVLNFFINTLNQVCIIAKMSTFWLFCELSYQLLSQTFDNDNNPYQNRLKCLLPLKEHLEPPQAIQLSVNMHCKSQRLSKLFFNTKGPQEPFLDEKFYLS